MPFSKLVPNENRTNSLNSHLIILNVKDSMLVYETLQKDTHGTIIIYHLPAYLDKSYSTVYGTYSRLISVLQISYFKIKVPVFDKSNLKFVYQPNTSVVPNKSVNVTKHRKAILLRLHLQLTSCATCGEVANCKHYGG